MPVQHPLGLFQRGADGNGDQILLGHNFFDRQFEAILKSQVAIGQDAHELALERDGYSGNVVLLHNAERIGDLFQHGSKGI